MDILFKNQTAARLRLDCDINITGYKETLIKYRKPSGVEGSWIALVESASEGIIYHDFEIPEGQDPYELDEIGCWVVWSWVKFSDDRIAPGEPMELWVRDEGELR